MRRWLALLMLPACSSVAPFPISDDVAIIDGGGFDSTLFKDAAVDHAVDAPTFGGGGPFQCIDCTCDGTLNVCEHFSGGKAPLDDGGDAGDASDAADDASDAAPICDPDAGQNYCAPIPIDCLPKPSCACVLTHYSGSCSCGIDPSGNGLVVTCVFP